MKMYCITIHDNHLEKIKKIGYIPVGLGRNIKSKESIFHAKYLSNYII